PRIMAAERSIDLYGPMAFNWPLAMALKEAMARGVKVRVILDQKNAQRALGNALLPYMLVTAPRRLPSGQETLELLDDTGKVIKEGDLPIRWFLPFRPAKQFASKDRSDLMQELHATTIIIDGRLALFGSASLDSLTWGTGLREYSMWVDDPALASESARQFDRLWNHPFLTVSHRVWLGEQEPSKEVTAGRAVESILQGGKTLPDRESMKANLAAEADRSRLLVPGKVLQDDKGRPQCRKL
ncbi:MAG TPA: phospholipase D family protein, partial [Oligoflexus sp.]|uniref:phospholipase D family protein n=1 Tax=Oligoflexus sp. TaxID=1971216 RepID=UPI002D7EF3CC